MEKLFLAILLTSCTLAAYAKGNSAAVYALPPQGDTTISIYFETGKSDIIPAHKPVLDRVARMMKMLPDFRLVITGNTDAKGPVDFNLALSEKRVESVYRYLRQAGVDTNRIEHKGYGELTPRKDNNTEAGRAQNRRVDMQLYRAVMKAGNRNEKKPRPRPFYIYGKVTAAGTKVPLKAEVVIEANPENPGNRRIASDSITGRYSETIGLSPKYSVNCYADGYLSHSLLIDNKRQDSLEIDFELRKIAIKQKLVFEHIYFFANKDVLLEQSYEELRQLHAMLKKDPNSVIEIQGHMNSPLYIRQTPQRMADNFDLSYRRAKAVYNYLASRGISRDRMSYRGMSNFKMIYPYAVTSDEMQRNMRVEIIEIEQ
jgi:outer membrane protein OmpA-like peptidoglycan-associated protein